ncbi:hypothetical protein AB0P21_01515 [Kribbella sp. NPDC056861]|uniref:hypothetical protein n=1 Tax=Kribbella sp. NPDC056861 TaxID=3154857 RepID=UPI003442B4D1
MKDVTGVTAMSLAPTGRGDVVDQLNAAAARRGWGLPVTIIAGVLGLFTLPYGLLIWMLAAPLCWWLFLRDKARRTVVLFYDVNDAPAAWFDAMVTNWGWLVGAKQLWREVQSGRVHTTYQHKTNAGASNLVSRVPVAASLAGPGHLATNVAVPSLVAGGSSLYFLPDRVLLLDNKHYTDISYRHLHANAYRQRFIESSGRVPKDAQRVGQTWQYVNVKGGPDRRFANNPVLPVMLYGNVDFSTVQGLDWRLQVSRTDGAISISETLAAVPAIEGPSF